MHNYGRNHPYAPGQASSTSSGSSRRSMHWRSSPSNDSTRSYSPLNGRLHGHPSSPWPVLPSVGSSVSSLLHCHWSISTISMPILSACLFVSRRSSIGSISLYWSSSIFARSVLLLHAMVSSASISANRMFTHPTTLEPRWKFSPWSSPSVSAGFLWLSIFLWHWLFIQHTRAACPSLICIFMILSRRFCSCNHSVHASIHLCIHRSRHWNGPVQVASNDQSQRRNPLDSLDSVRNRNVAIIHCVWCLSRHLTIASLRCPILLEPYMCISHREIHCLFLKGFDECFWSTIFFLVVRLFRNDVRSDLAIVVI